jgi:hypothetical protein
MPNCFQLYKKGEEEPSILQDVDNDLWLKFEGSIPEPNDKWYQNWYNTVGLLLAMGESFDQIKENASIEMYVVVSYLERIYTHSAWYSHK